MLELQVYSESFATAIPLWFYEGLLAVLCVGLILLVWRKGLRKGLRYGAILLLAEWVLLVLGATVFFREAGVERRIQIEPFRSYWDFGEHSYFLECFAVNVLNVALFVPIGLLLGFMVKGSRFTVRKGWMVALMVGMLISVAIETLQFVFRKGYAEVDDVIHNTLGCLVGYSLWLMVHGAWLKVHG